MTGKQSVRGVVAAALVVAMGSAAPAEASSWPSPPVHEGDSASPHASSANPVNHGDHVMTDGDMHHGTSDGHDDHGTSSGGASHDDQGATDGHEDGATDRHEDGATEGHDHGTSSGGASHDDQGATDGHEDGATDGHDSETGDGHEGGQETGHGQEPDTVSETTKARVLSGFGAVNAAAVGGAILLRRRDRRADRSRTRRADRRGRTVR